MALPVKNLPANSGEPDTQIWFLGREDPLEEGMASLSSILAWSIAWTKEPDKLQSIGSQRVGHNWSYFTHTHTHTHTHTPFDNFYPFHPPSTPAPGNYHSLLCLYKFGFLDSTYKWDHTIFVLLWLISPCIMPWRVIHVVTKGRILEITFLWQPWNLRLLPI